MKKFHILTIFMCWLAACSTPPAPSVPVESTSTPPPYASTIWVSPAVPSELLTVANSWQFPHTDVPQNATVRLDVYPSLIPETSGTTPIRTQSLWVYALVTPFPTVTDGITLDELQAAWRGFSHDVFRDSPLLMAESTLNAFTAIWGEPAQKSVKIVPEGKLLDTTWESMPSWAIVPFEAIQPHWKVLTIDGQSPIRKDLVLDTYPLKVNFRLITNDQSAAFDLPASNYDASKLTTVIMTGVTALTRATAQRMETKGITYPGQDIRDILIQADITHISNEVPFYSDCPYPDPNQAKEVFCSSPRYMELLTYVGMDVVELTGNHFGDYGPQAMLESLAIYNEHGIPHYGGGSDLADSYKPVILENNGNKFAFIGCNQPDVGSFPTATESRPGAAPCDFDAMANKIKELSSRGYFVFTTFQWSESPDPVPYPAQVETFRKMADAGALVVDGSQAHVPQYMEFYNGSFIHYGLGNLFFDQTGGSDVTRNEFIDRHVFYNGRYLGVELITAYLEDYSRPRLMTPDERERFLNQYFEGSGWLAAQAP